MPEHHVIIGGGPAATNAATTIRSYDSTCQITLLCDEPAHSRMALPYWLSGQIPREQTHTGDDDYFNSLKVDARIGIRANDLDCHQKTLGLSDGSQLNFDRLLIATGSHPRAIPIPGSDLPGVQHLWTLAQTEQILQQADQVATGGNTPRVVMIGAGFIGFIMLNAMYKRGWHLTVIEQQPHVLPRMLDADAAQLVESWFGSKGGTIHAGVSVKEIKATSDGAKAVVLGDGTEVPADIVVVAIGVQPNIDLVKGSAIDIDEGILVDDHLQTSVGDIYAAGDVAQGPIMYGEQKEVHAIQPTAVDHGRIAGANMAGENISYQGSLLMNVLDVCGLQSASFGLWNASDADVMTISNPSSQIFRRLLWQEDRLVGAVFIGRANDLGMLTDVGMIKGILQTETPLGNWKQYLQDNPFDIRRPYIATKVADKLRKTTLLNKPAEPRGYHFGNAKPETPANTDHAVYVDTKTN